MAKPGSSKFRQAAPGKLLLGALVLRHEEDLLLPKAGLFMESIERFAVPCNRTASMLQSFWFYNENMTMLMDFGIDINELWLCCAA